MADELALNGTITDDLNAVGGSIEFSGNVDGNAIFFAETVDLNGNVNGETIVFATSLTLNQLPEGTLIACVETLNNPINASVNRECHGDVAQSIFERAGRQLASVGFISLLSNPQTFKIFTAILPLPLILLMTGLAALVVAIFPRAINNIEVTIRTNPVKMLLTGLLLYLLMIGITVGCLLVLAYFSLVGLILFLFYLVLMAIFSVFVIGGWVTLSFLIGNWLHRRFSSRMMPPMITTVLGGAVLTVVVVVFSWLPLGNVFVPVFLFILETVGLGGSFATRLGRRAYITTSV